MKKYFVLILAAVLGLVSCEKPLQLVDVKFQLAYDGEALALAEAPVEVKSAAGSATYHFLTGSDGSAIIKLPVGIYTASANFRTTADGVRAAYNGANTNVVVSAGSQNEFRIDLQRVESAQIIIKELYFGGCLNPTTEKGYSEDAYIILYNNSDEEADASNIVFTFAAPYNGNGSNKYYTDGKLLYENEDWIPAYGAIWWFQAPVKIPAYSQIVVAVFRGIDHTQTVSTSVNLNNADYYWMSNSGIAAYNPTNSKYSVADQIKSDHHLTTVPISQGTAWALSNNSPAFYIGRMTAAEAKALSEDVDAFDHTLGNVPAFNVVKFPKAKVVDAVEAWKASEVAKSQVRFSADINTGYVAFTNYLGYSAYRNVDKEATEALAENAGKLVYNYAGGTVDVEGTTDPSGIDAEASIAQGAHIIYSDTNDTAKDFHQRKVASLKK